MLSVSTVPPERRREALSLLLRDLPEEERSQQIRDLLDPAEPPLVSLDGLIMAERDGNLVGVALCVAQADGTLFVWPPVVAPGAETNVGDCLLHAARRRVVESGAWIGQVIIESERVDEREALTRCGFPLLTELEFLQRNRNGPAVEEVTHRLESCPYDLGETHEQFAQVIKQTYSGTLDCPELNGLRSVDQAIAGHKLSGHFSPSRWRLYRDGDFHVGVLLLTEHNASLWEVVYLGVVPAARGKGYGREILLDGLRRADVAGVDQVILAVDHRNAYALGLYRRVGFECVARRAVHAHLISTRD